MTSHEFAKQLLAGPSLPIFLPKIKEYDDDESCFVEPIVTPITADDEHDRPHEILLIDRSRWLTACAPVDPPDTREGICCCGDRMASHPSPMICGHAPVDAGAYSIVQQRDELLEALKELVEWVEASTISESPEWNPLSLIREAIAKAEGGWG